MQIPPGASCWNAYVAQSREFHALTGAGLDVVDPDGCTRPATVALETVDDVGPGPRWYCRPCAVDRLQEAA